MTVTIYGASDDLIEVEGDLREEYDGYEDPAVLAFGDGTVVAIQYGVGGGFWRINRLAEGTATFTKSEATDEDDDYTDRVTLTGDLKWMVYGKQFDKIKP